MQDRRQIASLFPVLTRRERCYSPWVHAVWSTNHPNCSGISRSSRLDSSISRTPGTPRLRPRKTWLSRAGLLCTMALVGLTGLFGLSGCGRAAPEQDCQVIVDRNVELAMKKLSITDPAAIDKRKQQIRTEVQDKLKDCVGKNVTDKMMTCVKNAQQPEDIDGCFR